MSFCRITGKAKGLPRPNYFPLLAPISPADARRYCRITGKAYGLPSHHYIPVILTTYSNLSKCKVTNSADFASHHFAPDLNNGNRKHIVLADYRYVFPVFDESDDHQKDLIELLNSKVIECDEHRFVYPVGERKCSLVFPARLEAAVRDGDVRDVMLAKNNDTVLLKMKQGKNVSLELQDYNEGNLEEATTLFDGEGPHGDVILEREMEEHERRQRHMKRKQNLRHMAKIFESKEHDDDEELLRSATIAQVKRQKLEAKRINRTRKVDFHAFSVESNGLGYNLQMSTADLPDLVKPVIESWDWDTYKKEASKPNIQLTTTVLPQPCNLKPELITPKNVKIQKEFLENTVGFDAIACVTPLSPFIEKPKPELIEAIKNLSEPEMETVTNVNEKIMEDAELLDSIAKIEEIPDILRRFSEGKVEVRNKVSGLTLDIGAAKKLFVVGQMVSTPDGEVFVPGKGLSTPNGVIYTPGITVNTPTGISFIPGAVIDNPKDPKTPVFVAGHIVDDEFISGQTVYTTSGPRFLEGQTVLTSAGDLKFIAGVCDENDAFVCGQAMSTPQGRIFVPGQTVTTEKGEQFVAGQNAYSEKDDWMFVPGQIINEKFIAGKSVITHEGSKFVPGQYVDEDTFIPGISVENKDGLSFVPGLNVETKQGAKFVEGRMVHSIHGEIFMPGKSIVTENGTVDFAVAKTINDIVFSEPLTSGYVIDSNAIDVTTPSLSVYGHMVQTNKGIEFYPGKIDVVNLPEGKIIPGKLIRQDQDTKFVPGIMENGGFIPGQVVWTDKGEQFIPGQVIETSEGLKFVPGQVIETHKGSKFVPGQTIETSEGPRFIPGQIVQTKAGPTFIPGQVIYTEDGDERFVPGQVVDTEEGPRFVPGKVVETGDKVIFIPGQIVQTDQGPRFVAADLIDDEDGEHRFSVQSFLVAPEELTLLKPSHTWTTSPYSNGELSIDSNMLKQLSEAGMTIGRQIEASAVDIVLQSTKDEQTVRRFAEKFGIYNARQTETLEKLFEQIKSVVSGVQEKIGNEILTSVLHMNGNGHVNGNGHINGNGYVNGNGHRNGGKQKHAKQPAEDMKAELVNLLSTTILECIHTSQKNAGNHSKSKQQPQHHNQQNHNSSLYEIISQTLADKLGFDFAEVDTNDNNYANIVDCIEKILASPAALLNIQQKVDEMVGQAMRVNKVDLIKSTISKNLFNEAEILNNICIILQAENEHELLETVRLLSEYEPKILHRIVAKLRTQADRLNDETAINEILKKSIISAVRQSSDREIEEIISMSGSSMNANETNEVLSECVMETIALAKALGLADVVHNLWNAVQSCADVGKKLLRDEKCMELIQQVVVMRKLAKNSGEFKEALELLRRDPYSARKDPIMCKLFRCSGMCLISPVDKTKLTDSHEVPISLFCSDNQLAMQEFLLRRQTKSRGAFLIVKEGLQCVVPREASRDVLTGKCSYTVLDENGIRNFEPLHVFSALRLHFPSSAHRFSMYSCDVANDDDIVMGNGDTLNGHMNGLFKSNSIDKNDDVDIDLYKYQNFNGNSNGYKRKSFYENNLIQKQVF